MYFKPSPTGSSEHFLFSDNFASLNVYLLGSIDLPVLIELNGGLDIGMLLSGLIVRVGRHVTHNAPNPTIARTPLLLRTRQEEQYHHKITNQ
jgi:hypothetical protein